MKRQTHFKGRSGDAIRYEYRGHEYYVYEKGHGRIADQHVYELNLIDRMLDRDNTIANIEQEAIECRKRLGL